MLDTIRNLVKEQQGSGAIIAGLCLLVFIGVAALAVDIGHLVPVKEELQRAADAGAMAGVRALWPMTMPVILNPPSNPDCANAQNVAQTTATSNHNKVDEATLTTANLTITVGHYDYGTKVFTPQPYCAPNTNAVQVTAQKVIGTIFFARIWNITSLRPRATTTATMSFAKAVGKGTIPIAINKPSVVPGNVVYINFNPDPLDTGGWFADPPDSASAKTFKDYIGNDSCPPLKIGDVITLQNGVDGTALDALKTELANHPGGWDTYLPVVDTDKFNSSEPIVAFVPFRITEVTTSGNNKGVTGTVLGLAQCGGALPGSEVNYGVLAPPKAVN